VDVESYLLTATLAVTTPACAGVKLFPAGAGMKFILGKVLLVMLNF